MADRDLPEWNRIRWGNREYLPSKVVCVGRNFLGHIRELNNPIPEEMVLFIKPNSSISEEFLLPGEPFRYEAEIAFLVEGGELRAVGIGLDLTLREKQKFLKERGLPWEKSKAFDGSAVVSEFIDVPPTIEELALELEIDGQLRQRGAVREMLFPPKEILRESQKYFTLYDGDLLFTGTPAGVGEVTAGQKVRCRLLLKDKTILAREWTVLERKDECE